MLYDDRKDVRNYALQKIIHIRDNLEESNELRKYVKPPINFDCSNYIHMIDLENDELLSEPPFTKKIAYEHLKLYIDDDENEDPPLPDPQIACHIQGTERYIQLLTSVAKRSLHKNREGIMATVTESRKKISRMESKKDLQGNL